MANGQDRFVGYYREFGDPNAAGIPKEHYTHVHFHSVTPTDDGSLKLDQGARKRLERFEPAMRNDPETTFVLSPMADDSWPSVVSSRERRQRFATSAADTMERYGFDGVATDWEHPSTPTEWNAYVSLLETLRTEVDSRGEYEVSVALASKAPKQDGWDVPAMVDVVDYCVLLTYDEAGPWKDVTTHNAPFHDYTGRTSRPGVQSVGGWWSRLPVDPGKLVVGVPSYARGFTGVSADGDGLSQPFDDAVEYTYEEVQGLLEEGYEHHFDGMAQADYLYSPSNEEFVTYESRRSARLKAAYARENFGGVAVWSTRHDPNGTLIRAIRSEYDRPP